MEKLICTSFSVTEKKIRLEVYKSKYFYKFIMNLLDEFNQKYDFEEDFCDEGGKMYDAMDERDSLAREFIKDFSMVSFIGSKMILIKFSREKDSKSNVSKGDREKLISFLKSQIQIVEEEEKYHKKLLYEKDNKKNLTMSEKKLLTAYISNLGINVGFKLSIYKNRLYYNFLFDLLREFNQKIPCLEDNYGKFPDIFKEKDRVVSYKTDPKKIKIEEYIGDKKILLYVYSKSMRKLINFFSKRIELNKPAAKVRSVARKIRIVGFSNHGNQFKITFEKSWDFFESFSHFLESLNFKEELAFHSQTFSWNKNLKEDSKKKILNETYTDRFEEIHDEKNNMKIFYGYKKIIIILWTNKDKETIVKNLKKIATFFKEELENES